MQLFQKKIIYKLTVLLLSVGLTTTAMAKEIDVVKVEKLANEGNSFAQIIMGGLYRDGINVEKDLAKSFKWYEKAATQGDAISQHNIGVMYTNGMGVRQDYYKAVKWYRIAADNYYAQSQNNLGVMYENGMGVRQDYKIAKEWYGKACDNGDQTGCDNYRRLNN